MAPAKLHKGRDLNAEALIVYQHLDPRVARMFKVGFDRAKTPRQKARAVDVYVDQYLGGHNPAKVWAPIELEFDLVGALVERGR